MKLQLTAKNCRIASHSQNLIEEHIAKIKRFLPDLESNLVFVRLTIRRNLDRYFPPRLPHKYKTYKDSKTVLANFEGSLILPILKNRIYVRFKGTTIDECIKVSFERLFTKLEKLKDRHFSSRSSYPDHSSIRKLFRVLEISFIMLL